MTDINVQAMEGCKDISIYLGDTCNFNCVYCDRDYIRDEIGSQRMQSSDIPLVMDFLRTIGADKHPPEMISFHGGEPFTYVKIMDKFLDALVEEIPGDYVVFIQSNGSQMLQHTWFFEKWGPRLMISISYDFMYQDINRTQFGITPTLQMLREKGVKDIQFQYVMPISDPKCFSLQNLKSITDLCFKNGVKQVCLIPLRHYRGKTKFKVIVDEINLPQFFDAFLKFVQMLYIMGIDVLVDGHSSGLDKHYFDNHKQMILSPDGKIYPEYDFLEYQRPETVIGTWKGEVVMERVNPEKEDAMLHSRCITCPSKPECGLKYLFGMFDEDPTNSQCEQFYQMLTVIIKHVQKLKQQKTLLHWVGI